MTGTIRWGILGTGDIARQFASDLAWVEGAELLAIGSRRQESADRFAARFGIPRAYGAYEALAADRDVDVVYIGTPHPRHKADTLLCLAQGKAVLCEKPFALNAAEAEEMITAARTRGLFLMEAMWTAFFPAVEAALKAVRDGVLGVPRLVRADFAYAAAYDPSSRLFNLDLGGGALLDIGIYTVALAQMFLNALPKEVHSSVRMAETGVDEESSLLLRYPSGAAAVLANSLRYDMPQEALVAGDKGYIRLPHSFSQPDSYTICTGGTEKRVSYSRQGYGYHHEARAVGECLRAGRTECPAAPLAETRRTLEILDTVRAQWGFRYPSEAE